MLTELGGALLDAWECRRGDGCLDAVAVAIGHHFWKCETDDEARVVGMDCAREVLAAL